LTGIRQVAFVRVRCGGILAAAGGSSLASGQATAANQPSVLLVCNGSTAPWPAIAPAAGPVYRTVQGAVDAARPGDWILVYPGVYHEKSAEAVQR
jgi:pectin methylesterase-like acyl-CoA thioesterase